ncbi:MAG TPA: hypothetical protein VKZ45_00040 [Vicingaceae bacterium]|nr:hypothetical protein [Vicingaceae bacterium]
MTKEIKLNTFLLVFLIIGIAAIYFLAENGSTNSLFIIGGITAIKFLAVAFQFMETKKANLFWKILVILFVLAFLIGVFVLS